MLEATLVLMEGRADVKERDEGGQFPVSKGLPLWFHWAAKCNWMSVFAGETHGRIGVQLHVGAPDWPRAYELSKNLHR
jgi:hypothetical protein